MTATRVHALDASAGVLDVDLGNALPDVVAIPALGARALVRIAGRPVGVVDLAGSILELDGEALAALIWAELAEPIATGALAAGGPRPTALTKAGLDVPERPETDEVAGSLTVAIATRDRPETLQRCIDSVLAARPAPAAVIVVDNAPSDDRTGRLMAEHWGNDPRVRYVLEPVPGLGRAHNAALPLVETEHVAFTDDDVVVDPAWVGAIADAFAATPDVACVTGLIAPSELRTREQWWIERSTGFGKGFTRRVRSLRTTEGEGPLFPYDAGTLGSGANMAFAIGPLRAAGGFDGSLGTGTRSLGGDDLAALHRVVASGHDLVYEPAAIVFHTHHDTLPALERQARGYGAGLTAYLASVVAERPGALVDISRRALPGAARVLRPSSELNARRDDTYPRALVWRERAGMATGPFRYLRQRLHDRREGNG